MDTVAFVLITIVLAVAVAIFVEFKNRNSYKIEEIARDIISKRVLSREKLSPEKLMLDGGVPEELFSSGEKILKEIGLIFRIAPGRIRLDDTLETISKVNIEELDAQYHDKWKRCISSDNLILNIDKFFSFLEQSVSSNNWPEFDPKPQNEGEWLDLVSTLQIKDIILCWGPILD